MRELVKLPSLSNVAPGSTATLRLPLGKTYDAIFLRATVADGDTMPDQGDALKNIEVNINGKPIRSYGDDAELHRLNAFYGAGAMSDAGLDAGSPAEHVHMIRFDSPHFRTIAGRRVTSLGTKDVQSADVQAEIPADAPASFTLEAYAIRREPEKMGAIVKVKRFPVSFATAGEQDIDSIPRGPRIAAIHLHDLEGSDNVERVRVEADSRTIYDQPRDLARFVQSENIDDQRVPSTDWTHIEWTGDGDPARALRTGKLSDFRLRLDLANPGSVVAVVEYLDGFEGI